MEAVSVERASRLIDYFKGHARKAYAGMDADEKTVKARMVLNWIERNRLSRFTRREAHNALQGTFATVDELEPALKLLGQNGYIRKQAVSERPGPGRKPSPIYEVNPLSQVPG